MKELLIAGAIACSLLGQAAAQSNGQSQTSAPQNQTATPQNSSAIPDAPRPQPVLNGVVPGSGTTVASSSNLGPPPPATEAPAPVPTAEQPNLAADPADDKYLPNPNEPPLQTLVLRANVVDVPFTVKDSKGHLVPGLTPRDVRVYENGLRQKMDFFTVDPFPLSIALVIDQSLDFKTMQRVNDALGALQGAFTPYDEVAVFSYNNGPKLLTTFTGGQSARLGAVLTYSKAPGRDQVYYAPGEGLGSGININGGQQDNISPLGTGHGPGTPQGVVQVPREVHTLNDAILAAGQALTKTAKGRRRIVYVISDGKEYGSTAKQKDVIRYLNTNNISVWATVTGDSALDGVGFLDRYHLPLTMRDNVLRAYAEQTGGQVFAEFRSRAIANSFQQITEQVRTQYTLGFTTHLDPLNEKSRTLEVTVLRPNLTVIAKKGYYPTAVNVQTPTPQKSGLTPATPNP